jgi:hypothetical protein
LELVHQINIATVSQFSQIPSFKEALTQKRQQETFYKSTLPAKGSKITKSLDISRRNANNTSQQGKVANSHMSQSHNFTKPATALAGTIY